MLQVDARRVVGRTTGRRLLLRRLEDAVLARAYGLVFPASIGGIVAGSLIAAPVVEGLGLTGTLLGAGATVLVVAALLLNRPLALTIADELANAPAAQSPGSCEYVAMTTVLFVCRQNAGRSQMSQALFEQAASGRHAALSAGTTPAAAVHPEVVAVMDELGIDLSDRTPALLTRDLAERADLVVTMGCGDACPYIPGKRYLDWDLPDPAGRPIDEVRAVRDDIQGRVRGLVAELDGAAGAAPVG
jgi:arsenate reductase (thioredoxin)